MDEQELHEANEVNELRKTVLAYAATEAHSVVRSVVENGLSMGHLNTSVTVGGVEWHLGITYHANSTFVQIQGHPDVPEEVPAHPFALLFVNHRQDDASFSINLPAAWLPAQVPITDEPIREGVSN
jgi:hypothetical protein